MTVQQPSYRSQRENVDPHRALKTSHTEATKASQGSSQASHCAVLVSDSVAAERLVVLLRQKQEHESRLVQPSADPVAVWRDYLSWITEHLPNERMSVLARACKILTEDTRWHDDTRLLRLWCQLANEQKIEKAYKFLGSLMEQGVGTKHSLLYEAWASSLEMSELFRQAETVYQLGIEHDAQPLDRLKSRYAEFRNRMAKKQQPKRKHAVAFTKSEGRDELAKDGVHAPGPRHVDHPCTNSATSGDTFEARSLNCRAPISWQGVFAGEAQLPSSTVVPLSRKLCDINKDGQILQGGVAETPPVFAPQKQEVSDGSQWLSRKVPAGRTIPSFDKDFAADGSSDSLPWKRRRLGAPSQLASDSKSPMWTRSSRPQEVARPLLMTPPCTSVQEPEAGMPSWDDGMAAMGEKLLQQRDSKGHELCGQVFTSATGGHPSATSPQSTWSIASWLPFRKLVRTAA